MLIRKRETISYLQCVFVLDIVYQKGGRCIRSTVYFCLYFLYQKEGNCIIPTMCSCSRFCISERGKLHHIYNMFMIYIVCIRKRKTVSYLLYVYVLDYVYQKERKSIITTICSWSRICVSERGKLYHIYCNFMFYILCIRKRETVS